MKRPPPSGSTTARGYGWQHQKMRTAALAQFVHGQPCMRCGKPILSKADAELDHDDNDRTRYLGLSHSACNRRAGGQAQRSGTQTSEFGYWYAGTWHPTSEQW